MKLKNLFTSDTENTRDPFSSEDSGNCCGRHEICQKNQVRKAVQNPIEYYDDEELDIFKNRSPHSYTEDEVALFTEILHSMWKTDVPGWLASLQQRGIALPDKLTIDN
jgi:hypothetical protein